MKKERLDNQLYLKGMCDSRDIAKRLIIAGEVFVEGKTGILKPGTKVGDEENIILKSKPKYVSRGGLKLEKAIEEFNINVNNLICFDAGSSTGGFTDCLLQNGATKVYAYDVGKNQLAWKLKTDDRVISNEGVNLRYLNSDDIPEKIDLIAIDVSFISLKMILPSMIKILKPNGHIICLIKPQFELKKEKVGKGGIIRDNSLREEAVEKIKSFVLNDMNKSWSNLITSPIKGKGGNVEFLALIQNK